MNVTAPLFDAGGMVPVPVRRVATAGVSLVDEDVTGVAGMVLWGSLLDRLNVVAVADDRELRPIGPGGYTGGECSRAVVEVLLAGGEFVSDRALLAGAANDRLRGDHRLPSHTTLWRFLTDADLGRVAKAAAVNRTMLARAWALGAGPGAGRLTVDVDATTVEVYGDKHGAACSYKGEPALSPLIGVCGETGDVLAVRARGGSAAPGRALGRFVRECVSTIPPAVRADVELWVRSDSAGYCNELFAVCDQLDAIFTVTAVTRPNVRAAIEALAADPATGWTPAWGHETDRGSQVAETTIVFEGSRRRRRRPTTPKATTRTLRLIVRRQPVAPGDQLAFDDVDGWRYHAIVTNAPAPIGAAEVEYHHRRRGGIPEDTIRRLKEDFALNHAPLGGFFANWVWWQAVALAHNTARWVAVLALPEPMRRCRAKRLRLAFFNVAARVVRHAGQLWLRLPATHPWGHAFIEALTRIRALPAYA